jgi:hypothetical protein
MTSLVRFDTKNIFLHLKKQKKLIFCQKRTRLCARDVAHKGAMTHSRAISR